MKVNITPKCARSIGIYTQAKREKYSLKHCVTSTIHAAMADTLFCVGIQILTNDPNFKL